MAEFIPIATIVGLLIKQVDKTAQAANDVAFEKESFKTLARHLSDIRPVLNELQLKGGLNDSPVTRRALEVLESDVKKANNLVEKYKNRARFYLLIKCRHIVKEIQDVTRDIGKSLAALSLANPDLLTEISDRVNKLQIEMQRAKFESSNSRIQIVEKLNQGLIDQKRDRAFANDMVEAIAMAVGVPFEPSEISKELKNFKIEKDEMKERAEALFLEQVIELLSRADAARDYEEVKEQYFQRLQVIERYNPREEFIEPFKAFICCITGAVMVDPVSLCTGTACERSAIEARFEMGEKTDPETGDQLEDLSYRSNLQLRQSIQEWKELNYCVKIRSCKRKLLSDLEVDVEDAIAQMQELMRENSINKDWISIGGLTEIVVSLLGGFHSQETKIKMLITLEYASEEHSRNKDLLVEKQVFDHLLPYLEQESSLSKVAVKFLYELLQDKSGWNMCYLRKLSQKSGVISSLVALSRDSDEKAEEILMKLCDEDEDNIVQAAQADWYNPLLDRIIHGPGSSRMSMVRALLGFELAEENVKLLGEKGVILPLLEMSSDSLESKELSLSMIAKLLVCPENKALFADSGGVPVVLNLMFSTHIRMIIIVKCCEILEKLSSNGDGIKFLVDENRTQLDLVPVITNLLAFQQNPSSSHVVRRPALSSLLGICRSDAGLVKTAVLKSDGVSLILPLLDDSDLQIREVAIKLLFLFSQHEPEGVVEYLLKPRRLEAFVGFLENDNNTDAQMAAAGLLANLPKSESLLTERLIELGGLKTIVNILEFGTAEAKENALSALFRFTDPTNPGWQKITVEQGVYPLLVGFLRAGSVTAKARAAALIGDLSMRSHGQTVRPSVGGGCWQWFHQRNNPICPAHGGFCSVNTTFCLLEANALPDIVKLLQGEVRETAYEAIQTLSTLVREDYPQRGASVLHEYGAIGPILEVFNWGSESLKAEALGISEKVFVSREMVEIYGPTATSHLVRLTGRSIHEDGHLRRKAARVLLLIERCSRSSRSHLSGVSGAS